MKILSAGIKVERKIVYNDLKSPEVTIIILRLLNLGLKTDHDFNLWNIERFRWEA
mgnify:CR=1 FL=1